MFYGFCVAFNSLTICVLCAFMFTMCIRTRKTTQETKNKIINNNNNNNNKIIKAYEK